MKSALLVENNLIERGKLAAFLRGLGYVTTPVQTPEEALILADTLSFDIIITNTALQPNDRRTLTSELKRLTPESAIVLVTSQEEEYRDAQAGRYPCVSAVTKGPTTIDSLKRTIQFGLNAYTLLPKCVPPSEERRKMPQAD